MASATRDMYCTWVINALAALGRRGTPGQVYRWIKANESVPVADLLGSTSGGENLFKKEVRWARFDLRHEGIVSDREGRGIWLLA